MGKTESRKNNKKKTRHRIHIVTWMAILAAGLLTFLCALFFIGRWGLNAYYVSEAKKGRYHSEMESLLTLFNYPDGYVIWYNLGNEYYENGDYEEAEAAYLKAIECGIPFEKECPVKVNLALSMLAQLDEDEWDEFYYCLGPDDLNSVSRKVEKTLLNARDILTEDECAHEDDENGHDEQAQLLKDEIDELLEKSNLMQQGTTGNDQPNETVTVGHESDDPEDEPGTEISIDEDDVMDHIQEMLEENEEARTDQQQLYDSLYGINSDSESAEGERGEVW